MAAAAAMTLHKFHKTRLVGSVLLTGSNANTVAAFANIKTVATANAFLLVPSQARE